MDDEQEPQVSKKMGYISSVKKARLLLKSLSGTSLSRRTLRILKIVKILKFILKPHKVIVLLVAYTVKTIYN